jgi:hypothetical protein
LILTRIRDRRSEIPTRISPEAIGEDVVEMIEIRVGDRMTTIGDGGKVAVATALDDRVMTAMTVDSVPMTAMTVDGVPMTAMTVDGVPMTAMIHVLETPIAAIAIRNPIIRTGVRGDVTRKIPNERLSTTATFRLGILQYPLL